MRRRSKAQQFLRRVWLGATALGLAVGSLIAPTAPAQAVPTFNGGWTQPLDVMSGLSAGFLANNCGYPGYGTYVGSSYHIANDYGKAAGTAVYSIGAGTVVAVQTGWPGAAVFIRHTAADGTQFLSVYGHINNWVSSGTVTAGQQIGTVYNDGANSHLHFGIRAATTPAGSNNGSMPCSRWANANGYEDPLPFLGSHPVTSAPPPLPPAIDTTVNGTDNSVSGDFNGDGYGDVATLYGYGAGDTGVWLFAGSSGGTTAPGALQWRSGTGFSQPATKVAVLTHPTGPDDLVAFYDYGNSDLGAWLFQGSSSGLSAPTLLWRTGPNHWNNSRASLASGDFDNDGYGDVAALYGYSGDQVAVFTFQGSASGLSSNYTPKWTSALGAWNWLSTKVIARPNVGAADDLVMFYNYGNDDLGVWQMRGSATGLQSPGTQPLYRSGAGQWNLQATKLVAGNFDNDDYGDIAAVYNYNSANTALFKFNGASTGVLAPAAYQWQTGVNTFSWFASKPFAVSKGVGSQTVDDIVVYYNYGNADLGVWLFPDTSNVNKSQVWRSGPGYWSWGAM